MLCKYTPVYLVICLTCVFPMFVSCKKKRIMGMASPGFEGSFIPQKLNC